MIFEPLPLNGAWLVRAEPQQDHRGWFSRTFCAEEFAAHGLEARVAQCNHSHTRKAGTVRGLHYQVTPFAEVKLVRCVRGALFDVIVDVRPDSPTRGQWVSQTLRAGDHTQLYVPRGFAHGFQSLEDDTEISYQMSAQYSPAHARGIAHDDPALGIGWPLPVTDLSERDRTLPPLRSAHL